MDLSNSYRPQRPAGKAISIEEAWSQQQDSRSPMDAKESPLEVPRLLKMPGEMLHLICHHMDVDSFFVVLQTCKSFFTIGQYRPLLLRQIGRIPGLRLGLEDLDGLLDEFLSRARKNCLAAGIFAEMTLHTVFHHVPSLAKAVVSPIARDRLATVDGAGNILVLKLRKQSIELEFKLWPSDCDLNVKDYDVVRIAFTNDGRIAALYRPQPGVLTKNFKSGNDDAGAYDFAVTLVVFDLCFNEDRVRYAPDVVQLRRDFLCYKSEDPIGFSMAGHFVSCIARSNSFSRRRTVMRVYHIGLKPRTTHGEYRSQAPIFSQPQVPTVYIYSEVNQPTTSPLGAGSLRRATV